MDFAPIFTTLFFLFLRQTLKDETFHLIWKKKLSHLIFWSNCLPICNLEIPRAVYKIMYDTKKMKIFIKPRWVSFLSFLSPFQRMSCYACVYLNTISEMLKPWNERYSCEDSSHPEVILCESIISLNPGSPKRVREAVPGRWKELQSGSVEESVAQWL